MSTIDVEALLREITADAPSGEALEYDPLFLEMEQAAQGKPEQQMGEETIPAEAPNWDEAKKKALELAARTKDLRVGVCLIRVLVRTDGLPGLCDALKLLRGYVEQYWESVHPQLDAEDANDHTMRVNVLVALQDPEAVLSAVREAPLVQSKLAGAFSFKDVLVGRGALPSTQDGEPPTQAMINGVFSECELGELRSTADACAEAREAVVAIEAALTERVGSAQAADLSALPALLGQMHEFLAEQLAARGVGVEALGVDVVPPGGGEVEQRSAASGEIRSRDDVVQALNRIARYYEAHEPSSPIPLLMERAKRLVHADFVELVKDLAPAGLPQVENLRGPSDQEQE
jgi:type VI secretion system protein ImpA